MHVLTRNEVRVRAAAMAAPDIVSAIWWSPPWGGLLPPPLAPPIVMLALPPGPPPLLAAAPPATPQLLPRRCRASEGAATAAPLRRSEFDLRGLPRGRSSAKLMLTWLLLLRRFDTRIPPGNATFHASEAQAGRTGRDRSRSHAACSPTATPRGRSRAAPHPRPPLHGSRGDGPRARA
jgi:hypothetical protein